MSCYERHLVVRYKPSEKWIELCNNIMPEDEDGLPCFLQDKYPDVFLEGYGKPGKISIAPTSELFLDLLLECDTDCWSGEFYKSRKLTTIEHSMVTKIFNKMDINPSYYDLRLVDFCWYNCSEADDYFEELDDEFYHSKENLIMEVCNGIDN